MLPDLNTQQPIATSIIFKFQGVCYKTEQDVISVIQRVAKATQFSPERKSQDKSAGNKWELKS
jgi:hypothetical protein